MLKYAYQLGYLRALEEAGIDKEAWFGQLANWAGKGLKRVGKAFGNWLSPGSDKYKMWEAKQNVERLGGVIGKDRLRSIAANAAGRGVALPTQGAQRLAYQGANRVHRIPVGQVAIRPSIGG